MNLKNFFEEIQVFHLTSERFPFLSASEALLLVVLMDLPYPLASLREFKQIMSRVCENDRKRYKYLSRSPTSVEID